LSAEAWTIRKVLAWAADDLRARDSDTPRLDAELMLAHVLGATRIQLIVDAERPLAPNELAAYRALHKRRRAGEPVAYLRGEREFWGLPFRVDKRVLVPRPDTEILVEVALRRTEAWSLGGRALDLCTGSGCVAIAFAHDRPTWKVLGSDLSADAVDVARDNAQRLGVVPHCWFRVSDLFADLGDDAGPFELVTANPPYIPRGEERELAVNIRDFEPHLALFGGDDGFAVTRRIVDEAPAHLVLGGVLAMELGMGQAGEVERMLVDRGFVDVERTKDLAGIERVVSGTWPGSDERRGRG
jgi:release factor glutamine methyltransferase